MRFPQSALRKIKLSHIMRIAHLTEVIMQTPLRKMRVEKGLTIAEVAIATNLDVGNLSRIERGIQVTSIDTAEKLSRYFKGLISEMEILYPQRYITAAEKAA